MQPRSESSLKVLLPLSKQIPQSPAWSLVIRLIHSFMQSSRQHSTKFSQLPRSVTFDPLKPIQAASFAHCSNTSAIFQQIQQEDANLQAPVLCQTSGASRITSGFGGLETAKYELDGHSLGEIRQIDGLVKITL